jgi:ABC-type amino acid transport substrate-binding protein
MNDGDSPASTLQYQAWRIPMKFLALGLLLIAGAAHASCLEDIRGRGVVTAGTGLMGVKPSLWQDESGTYHGFDWDILRQIASRIGIPNIRFVTTEWTSLIPGLKAGRWDIILSDLEVTQERVVKAHVDFSRPYFLIYDYAIVLQDSPIKTLADLKGKTLGSTLGTNDSLTAHQMVGDGMAATVKDFNTFGDPFVALRNGQIDAVVLDQATLSGQRTVMTNLRTVGTPIRRRAKPEWAEAEAAQTYRLGSEAIATRQECRDLQGAINAALTAMDADGSRQTILTKYGVWEPEQAKLTK